tara:strand:- start:844 stop:2466 length:1623 start_codon:yes stop_codon:yes gene_type:complete
MVNKSFRKFLMLSLLSGAAFVPSHASAQAAKTPDIYFYPTQKWVTADNAGNCAIHNRFNNGFFVGLAGQKNSLNAVNVNFRQNVFEEGETYFTKLTIPGAGMIDVQAKAVSRETLNFDISAQAGLLDKIKTSSVLDIEVEGNEFRFYLTGFAAAAGNFESCITGVKKKPVPKASEPKVAELEVLAPPPPVSELEDVSAPVEKLEPTPEPTGIVASTRDLAKPNLEGAVFNQARLYEDQVKMERPQPAQRYSETIAQQMRDETYAPKAPAPAAPAPMQEQKMPEPEAIETAREEVVVPAPVLEKETPQNEKDFIEDVIAGQKPVVTPAPKAAIESSPEPTPAPVPETKVEETVAWNEPVEPAPAEEEAVEEKEAISVSDVVHYETPKPKVTKETVKMTADFTMDEAAQAQIEAQKARNDALLAKLSAVQKQLEMLKDENAALNNDLQSNFKASEKERVSIATDNWNLERATMKYNEAERQIKRLSQQLQKERAKWNAERKELEMTLFDPQITDAEQLARLAELEAKLAAAKAEIAKLKSSL